MLFSFCVTPKRFLHDLLANHRDAQIAVMSPLAQIHPAEFHCHADDLVVVAPFLPEIESLQFLVITTGAMHFAEPINPFAHYYITHTDSRGPPSFICS